MTDGTAPSSARPRRRVVQIWPAGILGVALILIPGVPMVLADALSASSQDPAADGPIVLETTEGQAITVVPPAGWQVRDRGSSVSFRLGEALVAVDVYDRSGRDVDAMAERLRRRDRLSGISAAPDGGDVRTSDGTLTGRSCVLTTQVSVGTCAVLADDEVVVLAQSLGTPETPALPLSAVLASLSKTAP